MYTWVIVLKYAFVYIYIYIQSHPFINIHTHTDMVLCKHFSLLDMSEIEK